MTTPHDPNRPTAPTVREIAALAARLREISARGRDVDEAEREAFLADKDALIARIPDTTRTDGAPLQARTGEPGPRQQSPSTDTAGSVITFEGAGYYSGADLAAIGDAIAAGDTERARQLQDRPWTDDARTGTDGPVMPEWMREQAIRATGELLDRTAQEPSRDDPIAVAERVGELGAEHGPSHVEATISRAEAARQLTERGHDAASAQAMVAEYLHETSRAVGVSVHQWGLDGRDVAAIAEQYAWVHDGNGQSLTEARERAGGYAQYLTDQAAALDPEHHPREAEQVARLAEQWADRARVPEPFTHPDGDESGDAAERGAEEAFDELPERHPLPGDEPVARVADRNGTRWDDWEGDANHDAPISPEIDAADPDIGEGQATGAEHDEAAESHRPAFLPQEDGSRAGNQEAQERLRSTGAALDRTGHGSLIIPEQDRRDQLARWHVDDQTTADDATVVADQADGAPLDLGRG